MTKQFSAVRMIASEGKTFVYLLAKADDETLRERLASEVGVVLRANRLCDGAPLPGDANDINEVLRERPYTYEVKQFTAEKLWPLDVNAARKKSISDQFALEEIDSPSVVFPWPSPAGPFLAVVESMVSQSCATCYTAYLMPTELRKLEREWLSVMSAEAASGGDKTRQGVGMTTGSRVMNPSSTFAGQLYMASLKRLTGESVSCLRAL